MKRFRFPLRPVAMLRTHLELRARESFATAVRAYVATEEELACVRARVATLETALFDGRRERFCAADEAIGLAAYRRECGAEMVAEKSVIAARAEMLRQRALYIEAHRHLDVVHRLEDKARVARRALAARAEQSEFDDFAGFRVARRRSRSG